MAALVRNVVSLSCAVLTRTGSLLQVPRLIPGQVQVVRGKKRWVAATMHAIYKRRLEQGPEPDRHRSKWINWNYDAEIYAFGKRLGESFNSSTIRTAFTHRSYIETEEARRATLGLGEHTGSLELEDNEQLAAMGWDVASQYTKAYLRHCLPKLPEEGVSSVHDHLVLDSSLAHLARNLGCADLILCEEFPPSEATISMTFKAVIGALAQDQGVERARLFVQDFVLTQLVGKTVADMWDIHNPMGMLGQLLHKAGYGHPEPRLLWETGSETMVAAYMVGIYADQQLVGKGYGETVTIAEELAARDALWRFFETSDNCKPFKFGTDGHKLSLDMTKVNTSISSYGAQQLK